MTGVVNDNGGAKGEIAIQAMRYYREVLRYDAISGLRFRMAGDPGYIVHGAAQKEIAADPHVYARLDNPEAARRLFRFALCRMLEEGDKEKGRHRLFFAPLLFTDPRREADKTLFAPFYVELLPVGKNPSGKSLLARARGARRLLRLIASAEERAVPWQNASADIFGGAPLEANAALFSPPFSFIDEEFVARLWSIRQGEGVSTEGSVHTLQDLDREIGRYYNQTRF